MGKLIHVKMFQAANVAGKVVLPFVTVKVCNNSYVHFVFIYSPSPVSYSC